MAFKMNWIHGALAVSLAANIFAGGYLLGKEIRPDRQHHERRMAGKELFSMRRLASYLPEEKRQELRALMKGHRSDLRANFEAIRGVNFLFSSHSEFFDLRSRFFKK